jgi:hypothetical protein
MSSIVASLLDDHKRDLAKRIMSPYAFFYVLGDALFRREGLSTVRMGDGERVLLKSCITAYEQGYDGQQCQDYDEAWRVRMGVEGITYRELYSRIQEAGNTCTHFGPSVSGLIMSSYDLFDMFEERESYVDNFFVNIWDLERKIALYKEAGSILFIHRNRGTADALQQRALQYLGVKVRYLELSNWTQTEDVIHQADLGDEPLVLFAGGPASKYLSPRIADTGKVVLDIGNTTDHWILYELTKT